MRRPSCSCLACTLACAASGRCSPRRSRTRVPLDTWLSTILLGRTAATIAELCFALQCALFLQRLSDLAGLPVLNAAAHAFVPLAIAADCVLVRGPVAEPHRHAIEESLWALLFLMLAAALGAAAVGAQGLLRVMLMAGCLSTASVPVDAGVRREDVRPPLAPEGHRPLPHARHGIARQPAAPAPDVRLGRLARGSTLDDALLQHRRVTSLAMVLLA